MHVSLNLHQIGHPHTGDMLADKLVDTLKSWGISKTKVLLVVTYNGSNMLKAIRVANEIQQLSDTEENIEGDSDTEDEDEHEIDMDDDDGEEESNEEDGDVDIDECLEEACHLHRFPCIAHTLQLVIKELSNSQTYCNLIVKVRSLVKFVKVSSVAQEKLIALCGKVVVKDCATRWNSVLLVLDRLLSIRINLEIVLKELKHDSLTNTEWERVADLQRLLAPFREQTDALQTDALSLSSVLPSILELTLHLQDQSLPKAHANMLIHSLRKRFSLFLDPSASNFDPLPAAACYLDPTVSSALMSEDLQPLLAAAKLYIKSKVSKPAQDPAVHILTSTSSATNVGNEANQPPLKRFKRLTQEIMERSSTTTTNSAPNSIEEELASYASETKSFCGSGTSALVFWVNAERKFPLLAPLAEDLISAPASEAYVERVFSICGELTSRKRNRLTKNLEARTFLKINRKYYD